MPSPVPIVTQEDNVPDSPDKLQPDHSPEKDHFEFTKVSHHRIAPKGSGAKYEVKVAWKHHRPSYVPVNVFTDNNTNHPAAEAAAIYAQKMHVINHAGFKRFKIFLPPLSPPTNVANKATHKEKLTINHFKFFCDCHYAMTAAEHLSHKAVHRTRA